MDTVSAHIVPDEQVPLRGAAVVLVLLASATLWWFGEGLPPSAFRTAAIAAGILFVTGSLGFLLWTIRRTRSRHVEVTPHGIRVDGEFMESGTIRKIRTARYELFLERHQGDDIHIELNRELKHHRELLEAAALHEGSLGDFRHTADAEHEIRRAAGTLKQR